MEKEFQHNNLESHDQVEVAAEILDCDDPMDIMYKARETISGESDR